MIVMPTVNVLPFDADLGYPQRQRVNIEAIAYDLFWRWNYHSGFCVLKIVRVYDGMIVLNRKLVEKNPVEIRDRSTQNALFTILPWNINELRAEVWVFV